MPPFRRLGIYFPRYRSFSSSSDAAASTADSSTSPPLADELFRRASHSGGYTQGDATYLSLALSFANASPPDLPSLRALLSRMRRDPRSFPERLFPPILRAFSRSGLPHSALHLFDQMLPAFSCPPSVLSLNSALAALLNNNLDPLPFFRRAIRSHPNITPNLLTFNLLLKALAAHSSSVDDAIQLFRDMPHRGVQPDAYSYSTLIASLTRCNRLDDALALLDEMHVDGIVAPSPAVFNPILSALCRKGDLQRTSKLVQYMVLKGCPPSLATYNTLVHGLCLAGRIEAAVALVGRMARDGCAPNQVTFGAIVNGLIKLGRMSDAVQVMDSMEEHRVPPNEYMYSALLSGMFRSGNPDGAVRVWEVMIGKGVKPNTVLYTALVDGFSKTGRIEAAEEAFSKMIAEDCSPNVLTYSSLIYGCFKAGKFERAMDTWREMVGSDTIEPNEISYSILINGLCEAGKLRDGMMVWKNMISKGCTPDAIAYSSMIRGLCAAGKADGGMRLLHEMIARGGTAEPDVVTYNILLDGLVKEGKLTRAMDLLGGMVERGVNPDRVTCNVFLRVVGGEEGKGREFMEGLVGRMLGKGRAAGAAEVVALMLGKWMAPERVTWERVVRGVCGNGRKVRKGIERCWGEIWR